MYERSLIECSCNRRRGAKVHMHNLQLYLLVAFTAFIYNYILVFKIGAQNNEAKIEVLKISN